MPRKKCLMKLHLPERATLTKGSQWYEGNSWALTPSGYALVFGVLFLARSILRYCIDGMPLGGDFTLFKVAAHYAMHGDALSAYIPERFAETARLFTPILGDAYWYYPPHFFFIVAPLDWFPPIPALVVWISFSLILLYAAFRSLLGAHTHPWRALTYSAIFMNADYSQTGSIIGAFVCWVLAWRERRPIAAGCMLALVACKPQFLVVLCIVLLIERRWKTLIAAGAAFAALAAITAACFGLTIWQVWFSNTHHALQIITEHPYLWKSLTSVFTTLRSWGASIRLANCMHTFVFAGVMAFSIRFYFKRPDPRLWNATILTATCFASPYFHVYDLAMLGAAVALVNDVCRERGWKPWEKEILTLTSLSPFLFYFLSLLAPLYLQPFALLLFFKLTISGTAPARSSP